MKNICVIGDSFCFNRTEETDWPVKLSQLLNLNLTGAGYTGQSWWFIRNEFLNFLNSSQFNNTELFVFCHTEQNRIIGTNETIQHFDREPNKSIVKTHLTYLENKEFNNWCCKQWFKELNELLSNKKVIHIQNFDSTESFFSVLEGVRFATPNLMDISLRRVKTLNNFLHDTRHNHFEIDTNILLAEKLAFTYNKFTDQWPKSIDEIMDI